MSQYDEMRERLEERMRTLTRRAGSIERDLRRAPSADSEERATEGENDEVLERLDEQTLAEIAEIRAALGRLGAGTTGCADAVAGGFATERLQALPCVTTCLSCADRAAPTAVPPS